MGVPSCASPSVADELLHRVKERVGLVWHCVYSSRSSSSTVPSSRAKSLFVFNANKPASGEMERPNLFEALVAAQGSGAGSDPLELCGPSTFTPVPSTSGAAGPMDWGPSTTSGELPLSGEDDTSDEEPLPPNEEESPDVSEEEEEGEEEEGDEAAVDGTIWKKNPGVAVASKTPARNIFRRPPTKIPGCQHVTHPLDAFRLFLTLSMIGDLVHFTNLEGLRELKDKWVETYAAEMEACLGLLLFLGTKKQNMVSTEDLWDSIYGCFTARICMSRRRFQILLTYMRFDDKATRSVRRQKDVFAPFRYFWDAFMFNLNKHYIPGACLTIDEQLVPFRGRCSFLQYLPSKPDRYGIKIFWVADAEGNYPLFGVPYLGRPAGQARQVNLGRNLALQLATPYFKSWRNVTCDNYFTDLTLAEGLLRNGLTMVGTVRQNKRFLPISFKQNKTLPLYGSDFAYKDAVTLVNYQSRRAKSTVALSTMHDTGDVRENTLKKKPEIILYYNATKGAVDTLDKMAHAYTVKRKSKRWPMIMFSNIMDMATIAARRIWQIKFPDHSLSHGDKRAAFIRSIAEQMMLPLIRERLPQTNLHRDLVLAAKRFIDNAEENDQHAPRNGRAKKAQTVLPGGQKRKRASDGSTEKKDYKRCQHCSWKKDRKTQYRCYKCNDFICPEHTCKLCPVCMEIISSRHEQA